MALVRLRDQTTNMNRSRNNFALLSLGTVAMLGATACNVDIDIGIDGSGVPETTTYDFESFDALDISSAFEAEVEITDGPPTVEITVDDNLTDRLEVDVDNGELNIGMDGPVDFGVDPTVKITMPALVDLELSGAASATVDGLEAEDLTVDLSGASDAELTGSVTDLTVDSSGASDFELVGSAATLDLELSGASSAELSDADLGEAAVDLSGASNASFGDVERVTGDLSGASNIEVPDGADVSVETSGASNVERG